MHRASKIYVAGHTGLVGSALVRRLQQEGYSNLVLRRHAELDLTDPAAVRAFMERERPEYVLLAAAKVGGILANSRSPADFIVDNLRIQNTVLGEALRIGVKRLLFLGSSCIYPRDCPQPIREEYLLTGPLEETNRAYAVAKIAGIEICRSFNLQHGTQYLAVMPTNIYGPGDKYDLVTSHALAALIRKAHEAKVRGERSVLVWGTGRPRREFLHSDDLADACVFLMRLSDEQYRPLVEPGKVPLVNIGSGRDQTISELASLICEVVGFRGELLFDPTKPDGTPRKLLDVSKMTALGWNARIGLREGIALVYRDYLSDEAAAAHAA